MHVCVCVSGPRLLITAIEMNSLNKSYSVSVTSYSDIMDGCDISIKVCAHCEHLPMQWDKSVVLY